MQRTRTQTIPQVPLYLTRHSFASTEPADHDRTETDSVSMFHDTITDDPVKGGEKYCKHLWKRVVYDVPAPVVVRYPSYWKTNYWMGAALSPFGSGSFNDTLVSFEIPNRVDMADLATRALMQMSPSVNEGLSVVNFILELKDLKRMFQLWKKRSDGITNISAAWLNFNFGWKPFIADVLAMVRNFTQMSKKLDYLEKNAGKVLRRNYRRLLDSSVSGAVDQVTTPVADWVDDVVDTSYDLVIDRSFRWIYPPTYHATLVYRYSIPARSQLRRAIEGYADAFGVRLDPSIIWNAIPFSFVIDWFINVGSFLESFSMNNLGIVTDVLDFSHSVKYHAETATSISVPDIDRVLLGPYKVKYEERSYYERVRSIPDLHRLSVEMPSMKQWSLGAALVIANGRSNSKHVRRASRLEVSG